MSFRLRPNPLPALLLAAAVLPMTACGGGGGSSASSGRLAPPAGLTYDRSDLAGTLGLPLARSTPSVQGPVASWSIEPALPAGLSFDAANGAIEGTPTELLGESEFVVTARNSAGVATVTLSARVTRPDRFAFVADRGAGVLTAFTVHAADGDLAYNGFLPRPSGLPELQDAAAGVDHAVVYAAYGDPNGDGTLVAYSVDATDGSLSELDRATLDEGPHRLVVHPGGDALYVTSFTGGTVRGFELDDQTGALAPLGQPVAAGTGPESLAVVGGHLVVANRLGQSLSSFVVRASSKALSPIGVEFLLNGGIPSSVASARDGEHVLVTLENFSIAVAPRVDPDTGELDATFGGAVTGLEPSAVAVHPSGRLALVADRLEDSVTVLRRRTDASGPLFEASTVIQVGDGPARIAFDRSGARAWVATVSDARVALLDVDVGAASADVRDRWRTAGDPAAIVQVAGDAPVARSTDSLYVLDHDGRGIDALRFDDETGVATAASAPAPTGAEPASLAVDPRGRFVFTVQTFISTIASFRIEPDASLSVLDPGLPTQTSPTAVAMGPNGDRLVVASSSPPLVSVYRVDPADGSLALADLESVPSSPGDVAVDPTGRHVYVTSLVTSQITALELAPDGTFVGAPVSVAAPGRPRTLRFTRDGLHLLTALEGNDRVIAFRVGASGDLEPVSPSGSNGLVGDRPVAVAAHPDGTHVLAAVHAAGATGEVAVLALDASAGVLSTLGAVRDGLRPRDVLFDASGRWAFASNEGGGDLSVFAFDGESGALTPVGAVPLGTSPTSIGALVGLE